MRHELSYYIGCECVTYFASLRVDKVIDGQDVDLAKKGFLKILPILRPMSEIYSSLIITLIQSQWGEMRTKIRVLGHKLYPTCPYMHYDTKWKFNGGGKFDFDKLTAGQVDILIQNKFDVFGLIEAGEAITEEQLKSMPL